MPLNMESILGASFGEGENNIRVSFKKTVSIKPYETEVVELESTLKMNKELTGAERVLLAALLQVQLEYEAYVGFLCKGQISQDEFDARKAQLEHEANIIKMKAESVLQKSLDEYFTFGR